MSPWPIVFVAIRPKAPLLAQQVERPAEEVGNEVGVAVRFVVDRLEPIEIALPSAPPINRVLARERRVAHERIETPDSRGRTPRETRSPSETATIGLSPMQSSRRAASSGSRRLSR